MSERQCEVCRKWCEFLSLTLAIYRGKTVRVCHDCKRAIEIKNSC